eukprot:scaffold4224_cov118-Skeletonema_dohrnii-CCMP3373.AAC.1
MTCRVHANTVFFSLKARDASDRHSEAILGAGEALRYRDLAALVERFGSPSDPIDVLENEKDNDDKGLSKSLVVTVLNGYVRQTFDRDTDNITNLKTLSFVLDRLEYLHDEVLLAMDCNQFIITSASDNYAKLSPDKQFY